MKTLLSALALLSLGAGTAGARQISGRVLSDADSLPLPGAVCELRDRDKVLARAATDSAGLFALESDFRYAASVLITMHGYAGAEVVIPDGNKPIDTGAVYLGDSSLLPEVLVTASAMTDSRGYTIVYPSGEDVKASSTSLSLFQKLPLPGLAANPFARSISVEGGTPMILIDGVPSSMDDLNSLNPKDILKVEYSRLTPPRYAASGKKGFISITRKQRTDGGSVYLWGRSTFNIGFMDYNLRASYHQGPSEFTVSYNPSWRNYTDAYDNATEAYVAPDYRVDIERHDRDPFHYFHNPIMLRYNFRPTQRTVFSATFSATPFTSVNRFTGHGLDSEQGAYKYGAERSSKTFSPSLDLFLRHDFNPSNSLEVELTGTLASDDYRRRYTYDYDYKAPEEYVMDVDNRRRSLITEMSYVHSFSEKTSLTAGYRNSISHSRNTYLSDGYRPTLDDNDNYAYVRLGQQAGPVYLEGSTGLKYYWSKNGDIRRHYLTNNSRVSANWRISPAWSVQAYFNYSTGTPSLSGITDHIQQVNPYLFSNGNPDLKTSQTLNWQLGASYNGGKVNASFNTSVFDMIDPTISDVTYMGDGKFLQQTVNYASNKSWHNQLYMRFGTWGGFGANLVLNLDYYHTRGAGWRHDLTFLSGSVALWWNKDKFTVQYWRSLPAKRLSGQTVTRDENGDQLSVEFSPDKHWTIGAAWFYMFDPKGTRYPNWNYSPTNPGYTERHIRDNGNMVTLSVQYRTDFGSIFRTGRRTLNNRDQGSSLLKL